MTEQLLIGLMAPQHLNIIIVTLLTPSDIFFLQLYKVKITIYIAQKLYLACNGVLLKQLLCVFLPKFKKIVGLQLQIIVIMLSKYYMLTSSE